MAGGLHDVLAIQGVVPVSATATATGGLTLLQLSGVWITGAPVVTQGGLTLLQFLGVWITGATLKEPGSGTSSRQPHGAHLRRSDRQKRRTVNRRKMAALAILAIQEYYGK